MFSIAQQASEYTVMRVDGGQPTRAQTWEQSPRPKALGAVSLEVTSIFSMQALLGTGHR